MKLSRVRPTTAAFWAVLGALGATIVTGFTLGLELALLVIAGSVLVAVIALFWSSVRNLAGDTPLSIDEALGMGAPTAAEEQKRAVLRALKDLEFERGVGKISEQDYLEYSARYRAEAKRLIAAVDESLGPVQELAEKLANERLREAGLLQEDAEKAGPKPDAEPKAAPPSAPEPETEAEDADEEDAEAPSEPGAAPVIERKRSPAKLRTCASCKTENDSDAAFCKRCGATLETPPEAAPARVVEKEVP
jgi:hypothetical protein